MKSKHYLCLIISLMIVGLFLWGCDSAAVNNEKAEEHKRNHPSAKEVNMGLPNFMPGNNDVIIFDYSTLFWSKIATYNLKTGELRKIETSKIKQASFPGFSPDGKKIVFLGAHDEYGQNRNIYIMNADGSDIQRMTDFDFAAQKKGNLVTSNFAKAPSFSPDGNRIIYAKSRFTRERAYPLRGTMHTAWDVYEMNITTGKENRLTHYDFYEMSWPYYMPDGKRFIFSAEGPVNTTGRGPKNFKEYEALYQKNFIFIMDGSVNDLKPAFTYGNNSNRPCITSDGSIIFLSETGGKENSKATQDLFIYKNGQIKRLTQLDSWIDLATASSDGQCIIFSKRTGKNTYDYSDWLMKIDGTMLQEIKMPLNLLKQ